MTPTSSELRPLSARDNVRGFVSELRYPDGPGGSAQFFTDHRLLDAIAETLRLSFPVDGRPPTVADIPEARLNEIAARHEELNWGQVVPERGDRIHDRLDEWFRPHQVRHAEQRRVEDERMARYMVHSAELDRQVAEANERQTRAIWGLEV